MRLAVCLRRTILNTALTPSTSSYLKQLFPASLTALQCPMLRAQIALRHAPYSPGDGITDLEAVQATGGADLFIGFGGVVERPAVAAEAEWCGRCGGRAMRGG